MSIHAALHHGVSFVKHCHITLRLTGVNVSCHRVRACARARAYARV
nr:MAG TPA: hypothetical protein [Caudoviricetes sp.]